MLSLRTLIAPLILALLPACGPPKEATDPSAGAGDTSGASTEKKTDATPSDADKPAAGGEGAEGATGDAKTDAPKPGADKPAEEAKESESMVLARDFLKSGGRRIGYSATKKMFAFPMEQRTERGFGLDIQFVGEDGQPRDRTRVCQIGECEEHLDEIVKELLPKLAGRLESEGYIAIRGIGWPQERDELEVSTLSMKLKYTKGRFDSIKDGKTAGQLRQVGGKKLSAESPFAIFIVPDSKFLGVLAPPSGDAKGLVQDFFLFKLP